MSLPTCYRWWDWSQKRQSAPSGERSPSSADDQASDVRPSTLAIARVSPSHAHNSPDEASVLFSLSDGGAEVRSGKPKVAQLVSGKVGIQTQFSALLKPTARSISWLCHFPWRPESSIMFIKRFCHQPMVRNHRLCARIQARRLFLFLKLIVYCHASIFYFILKCWSWAMKFIFVSRLRAVACSLKTSAQSAQTFARVFIYIFSTRSKHTWRDWNTFLGGQPWTCSAGASLPSSSLVFAGPAGRPQALGRLPGRRVGVLGAGGALDNEHILHSLLFSWWLWAVIKMWANRETLVCLLPLLRK